MVIEAYFNLQCLCIHIRYNENWVGLISILFTIIAMLSPNALLSSGDPKQEANAISGFPALVTTVSATQSATQFPIASTVRPKIAEEMPH